MLSDLGSSPRGLSSEEAAKRLERCGPNAVVVANAAIGFVQESKVGRAIEELLKYSVTTAKVRRAGAQTSLYAKNVVPGDMLPADIRFIPAKDVFVDESIFTGESQAVLKKVDPLKDEWLVPADQVNMGFSGTILTRGRGKGSSSRPDQPPR